MKERPDANRANEATTRFHTYERPLSPFEIVHPEIIGRRVGLRADLPSVDAILKAAYAPGDVVECAGFADTCDRLHHHLADRFDHSVATAYLAHVLQELRITSSSGADLTAVPITMESLFQLLAEDQPPWEMPMRFMYDETTHQLSPMLLEPVLRSVEDLPLFQGELLRGKKVLCVGIGGGSDVIQAAAISEIVQNRFGTVTTAFASVRKAANQLNNAEQASDVSTSLQKIHAGTSARGGWRFLENIMLTTKDDPLADVPMYIINSIESSAIETDLRVLVDTYQPEIVIAVDTGGDSLYYAHQEQPNDNEVTHTTPDQDRSVLEALNRLANPANYETTPAFLTAIVAPGVDAPSYAYQALWEAESSRLFLTEEDKQHICARYATWGMDGSGNERNRYGMTSLAWLAAINKSYGLTTLDLPVPNVVSADNPWRSFMYITPAMGEVVLMDTSKHARVIGL